MNEIVTYYKKIYHENHTWIKSAVSWFALSSILGGIIFFIKPSLLTDIISSFKTQFGDNPALDFHLVLQIFIKNIIACAVALFGGIIFGLAPIAVIAVNGILLGFVGASVLSVTSNPVYGLLILIGGILPHGIFELPTFIVASALGLRFGFEWLGQEAKGNRWQTLKKNFKQGLAAVPALAIVLFIAAIIEVFVSGRIVDNLR